MLSLIIDPLLSNKCFSSFKGGSTLTFLQKTSCSSTKVPTSAFCRLPSESHTWMATTVQHAPMTAPSSSNSHHHASAGSNGSRTGTQISSHHGAHPRLYSISNMIFSDELIRMTVILVVSFKILVYSWSLSYSSFEG